MTKFWKAASVVLALSVSTSLQAVEPEQQVPDFTLKSMAGDNFRLKKSLVRWC